MLPDAHSDSSDEDLPLSLVKRISSNNPHSYSKNIKCAQTHRSFDQPNILTLQAKKDTLATSYESEEDLPLSSVKTSLQKSLSKTPSFVQTQDSRATNFYPLKDTDSYAFYDDNNIRDLIYNTTTLVIQKSDPGSWDFPKPSSTGTCYKAAEPTNNPDKNTASILNLIKRKKNAFSSVHKTPEKEQIRVRAVSQVFSEDQNHYSYYTEIVSPAASPTSLNPQKPSNLQVSNRNQEFSYSNNTIKSDSGSDIEIFNKQHLNTLVFPDSKTTQVNSRPNSEKDFGLAYSGLKYASQDAPRIDISATAQGANSYLDPIPLINFQGGLEQPPSPQSDGPLENLSDNMFTSTPDSNEYIFHPESSEVYDFVDFQPNDHKSPGYTADNNLVSSSKTDPNEDQTQNQASASSLPKSSQRQLSLKKGRFIPFSKLSSRPSMMKKAQAKASPFAQISSNTKAGIHIPSDIPETIDANLTLEKPPFLSSSGKKIGSSVKFHSMKSTDYLNPKKFSVDLESYSNKQLDILDKINTELMKKQLVDMGILYFPIQDSNYHANDTHKSTVPQIELVSFNIYINDTSQYFPVKLLSMTSVSSVLGILRKFGIVSPETSNWAIYDVISDFFIERTPHFWEPIGEIIKSWEPYSNNYILAKSYPLYETLSLLKSVSTKNYEFSSVLHFRNIKLKWVKSQFELSDSVAKIFKPGKSKKDLQTLPIEKYDIYIPFMPIKNSPTQYVFALKPELPMQVFEKPEINYIKFFSVQSQNELEYWLNILRMVKNQLKFKAIVEKILSKSDSSENTTAYKIPGEPLIHLDLADHSNNDAIGQRQHTSPEKNSVEFDTNIMLSLIELQAKSSKTDINSLFGIHHFDPSKAIKHTIAESSAQSSNYSTEQCKPDVEPFSPSQRFQGETIYEKIKNYVPKQEESPVAERVYKKGSLLDRSGSKKFIPVAPKQEFTEKKFTSGSLLENFPKKAKRPTPGFILGKPLIDISSSISATKNLSKTHSSSSSSKSEVMGVKPMNFRPLLNIDFEAFPNKGQKK